MDQDAKPNMVTEPEVEPGFSPKPQSTEDPLWTLNEPSPSPSPSPRPPGTP